MVPLTKLYGILATLPIVIDYKFGQSRNVYPPVVRELTFVALNDVIPAPLNASLPILVQVEVLIFIAKEEQFLNA